MIDTQKHSIKLWIQALRAPFFTASLIPVFAGAVLALFQKASISWVLFPIVILCSLLLHAGTNLINDYYDFKRGIDRKDTFGSSRVLVDGLLEPRQILLASLFFFAAGFLLSFIIIAIRGLPLLILSITGILGGYIYSGGPRGLKYLAMGEVMVFFLMGPLMVIGSYLSLTGNYNNEIFFAAIPIGALVTAILYANNLRDFVNDKQTGVVTLVGIFGYRLARLGYAFLIILAYGSVLAMVYYRILHPVSLAVFISLPVAIQNTKAILTSSEDKLSGIVGLDIKTAKLHFLFGLLFILSIAISAFIS